MCPHWLRGDLMGWMCHAGKVLCWAYLPSSSILGVGGTGRRLLGAMTDGAAGDGEKRAKLQLQVQEQTIAGVLRGARGRIRGQWSYL